MNSEIEEKIKGWFYKSEPDYFVSFATLWFAFNAYYKAYYQSSGGNLSRYNDTAGKNKVKECNKHYKVIRKLIRENNDFRENIGSLAEELKYQPLQNMRNGVKLSFPEEALDSNSDISECFYKNLVDILYTIRNNMFHGDKEIVSERDGRLVELAYKILHGFMSEIIEGDFAIMRQSK